MKHARSVLMLTLALAASCPPAVAVAEPIGPIGSPPESPTSRGVDGEPSDGGAAVLASIAGASSGEPSITA